MAENANIVRYTSEELAALIEREGTQSDWDAAVAMSGAEIEVRIAADPDETTMAIDWENASVELERSE